MPLRSKPPGPGLRPTRLGNLRLAALGIVALVFHVAGIAPVVAQISTPEKATMLLEPGRGVYPPGSEAELIISLQIDAGWHTNSHEPTYDYLIPTAIAVASPPGWESATLAYPRGEMKSFAFALEEISVYEGLVVMVARQPIPDDAAPGDVSIEISLTFQACDDRSCLPPVTTTDTLLLTIGEGEAIAGRVPTPPSTAGRSAADQVDPAADSERGGPSLAWMLILAWLGGLILNAMPCVLPILSLKVFGLVKSAGLGRRQVVSAALATTAGILASFWALATLAIAAKAGGRAVGWGVQFQEPTFVAGLTVVVLLFCLNLWGLFEVPLPASLASAAGGATGQSGTAGHFTSGLFATLMATPCSAPFLGTAVGFGLSQSSGTILAIFTAVGLGMATPYLLLAAAPGAARLLPRPGPWMEHMKTLMGFLLAAAAIWLLYVLSAQVSPERLAFFEASMLLMATLIWWRHAVVSKRGSRLVSLVAIGASILLGLILVRGSEAAPAANVANAESHIDWSVFDRERAETLADAGQLVFVDVTADWCFTCKVNERLALETEEVGAAFERHDVVAMKADWTNRDEAIAIFLSDHDRYGIPFYLLYRPGAEPLIFGELITKQEIVDALEAASG